MEDKRDFIFANRMKDEKNHEIKKIIKNIIG